MMTPSALVKLASTWINNGRRFGPSETLRGLRNARRTSRRPVRPTRYHSGITRCIVRSILSAIVETSSVMIVFGCESYAKARRGAMQRGLQKLQHLVPLALVFKHDFSEETNGWHAVAEQFVVKFL